MKYCILIGLLACFSVNAAPKEYKCFIETTSGHQISFYKWDENQVSRQQANLLAKRVNIVGSNQKTYVKDVIECVELSLPFQSSQANELDQKTLR